MDYFCSRIHRELFECIRNLIEAKKPVDLLSVTDELKRLGTLEEVGGVGKVSSIITAYPQRGIESYIEVLKEKMALRELIVLGNDISKNAYVSDSPKDLINQIEGSIFKIQKSTDSNKDSSLGSAVSQLNQMIEVRKSGQVVHGLPSGIKTFDDIQGGFQKGQYYVLGGRPSMGKTAFADQVAINVLKQDKAVLYLSLESSSERVLGKMACKMAGVSFYSFIRNLCSQKQLIQIETCLEFLKTSKLSLVRPSQIYGNDIRSLILKEKRKNNTELFVMDYLQKVSIAHGQDERRAVSDASMAIQSSLVETGVPGLILVQLNREAEKESRPRMGHLKESGQIEQDADNIALLWSEVDRNTLSLGQHLPVILSIEKNKDGASGLDQEMIFDRELMTFKEKTILNRNLYQ